MLNLELRAEFGDHFVIEIGTIICDDPFGDVVPTYKIMLDESSHNILGNICERGCFYPFGKVIDNNKDETMPIRSGRLDFSNHVNSPHRERPRGCQNIQWNLRYMHFVCLYLAFVTRSGIAITINFHRGALVSFSQNLLSHCMSIGVGTECTFM